MNIAITLSDLIRVGPEMAPEVTAPTLTVEGSYHVLDGLEDGADLHPHGYLHFGPIVGEVEPEDVKAIWLLIHEYYEKKDEL